jgi:hypothetical protein
MTWLRPVDRTSGTLTLSAGTLSCLAHHGTPLSKRCPTTTALEHTIVPMDDAKRMPPLGAVKPRQKFFNVIHRALCSPLEFRHERGAAAQPTGSSGGPLEHGSSFGEFAGQYAASRNEQVTEGVPSYRVTFNDRLNPTERFITIAHELGHIFLGHLGECASGKGNDDESGWPHSRVRHRAEQVLASARPARKGWPQTRQNLKANLAIDQSRKNYSPRF